MRIPRLIVFLASFHISATTIQEDLQEALDFYKPKDPKCIFNYSEVTSKNIQFFPNCQKVYGILVINENTDLTVKQLQKAFENMTSLYGGIKVENSNLASLSFLWSFMGYKFQLFCETYGLFIENNSKLNDAEMLRSVTMNAAEEFDECEFRVENNTLLNMENVCKNWGLAATTLLEASGNLKECGCSGSNITSSNIALLQNCTETLNGLQLFNITNPSDLPYLYKIRVIKGPIDIQDSNIQNLSFLDIWKEWIPRASKTLAFNLRNNPNMTRLDAPRLKEINNVVFGGYVIANFENLHPDFCLTIEELNFFMSRGVTFQSLQAKVCEDPGDLEDQTLCKLVSLKDLPNNCNIILGDLNFGPGDEAHFSKLQQVTHIFGHFHIVNTTLVRFNNYLDNLQYIVNLDNSTEVIKFVSNPRLKSVTMLSLKSIITNGNRDAILQDNHPDIFKLRNGKKDTCALARWIGMSDDTYPVDLNFIGGDCGERLNFTDLAEPNAENLSCKFIYDFVILILIISVSRTSK